MPQRRSAPVGDLPAASAASAELWQETPTWRKTVRQRLRAWYRRSARDLPWRRTSDPYAIWVSEIMLQQTQVATVIPYFERFLSRFPDVQHLARARETTVLRYWEGLGYYRRARQLHAAAKTIVRDFNGNFPTTIDAVRGLPGVGRYTAGAVLSFALDQPHPIVEANTLRLYSRLIGMEIDPRKGTGHARLWEFAEHLVTRHAPGELNQALIELGATTCLPKQAACDACPLEDLCQARRYQRVDAIPVPPPKTKFEAISEAAVAVQSGSRLLMRQCGVGERWAGLWDFPRTRCEEAPVARARLSQTFRSIIGSAIHVGEELLTLKHGVTRYRIQLTVYRATLADPSSFSIDPKSGDWRWVDLADFDALPLSTTGRRIAQALQRRTT